MCSIKKLSSLGRVFISQGPVECDRDGGSLCSIGADALQPDGLGEGVVDPNRTVGGHR